MAGLQSLAFEILHEITALVCGNPPSSRSLTRAEAKALCDIRRICQLTNAVAEPMLFRHLVMNIDSQMIDSDSESAVLESPYYHQLRDLAEGSTNASTHAKALTLGMCGEKLGEAGYVAPYMRTLALALGSLHNVNSVIWTIGTTTAPAVNTDIIQCLSALPLLVDLEIDGWYGTVPCLSPFQGLQRISVTGISSTCDGLQKLVASCPGLLHLNIEGRIPFAGDPIVPPLPEIFAHVSLGRRMRIRSLGLSWFQMRIGSDMLSHLQSLESLRLHHHKPGQGKFFRVQKPLYDITKIWKSLQDSEVNLRHLDVDYVDSALLDYLATSSGLETLRITTFKLHPRGSDLPEDLAYRFFTAVMPRHSQSLNSLYILVPPSSKWCFHTEYLGALMRCQKLDTLSLSIASWKSGDPTSLLSDVHTLIEASKRLSVRTLVFHAPIT